MNKEREQRIWWEWSEARRDRSRFDLSWFVQYAWYGGETDVFFDSTRRGSEVYRVNSRAERSKRVRPINLIGHAIDILVSKHMKPQPIFDAAPASSDQGDIMKARASRDWLRWFYRRERVSSRRHRLMLDRAITGNGFAKVFYDPFKGPLTDKEEKCPACIGGMVDVESLAARQGMTAGDLGLDPYQPCPMCQGKGTRVVGRAPIGDVSIKFPSPWEIYVPPEAQDMETTPSIFHAFKISRADAAARYGVDADKLNPSSFLEEGDSDFARLAASNRTASIGDEDIYVIEKHERPPVGTEHPLTTIVVGDQIVWPREGMKEREEGRGVASETPHGRIPFFHFRFRVKPGEFFARGRVLDVISANDTVNRGRHSLDMHIRKMAQAKWVAEKGSISNKTITNEEGEVIEYTGVNAPRQISPAPMPEYVRQTIVDEEKRVYENLGISEIERGTTPPNVEAAEAFAVLIEQSETSHGPVYTLDADNWEQIGRSAVLCAIANYEDDQKRLVRVVGPGGGYEAKMLAKADLTGDVDIHVELGGKTSQSLALRRADVLRFAQAGLMDPKRAMELSEFGQVGGEFNDEARLQESVACQENDDITEGKAPHQMTVGLDDHEIHTRIHRNAALNARIAGNVELAAMLTQAAIEHEQAMMPPPEQGGSVGAIEPEQSGFDTPPPMVES